MESKVYVKQIEHPMSQADAIRQSVKIPNAERTRQFSALNSLSGGKGMLYPGHLLLMPSSGTADQHLPLFSTISESVNHQVRHSTAAPAPKTFNGSFAAFVYAQKSDIGADGLKNFAGEGSKHLSELLHGMSRDLSDLNRAYIRGEMAVRGNALPRGAPRFQAHSSEKGAIYSRLQAKMRQVPRALTVMDPGAATAEDALQLSHMDVKRAFKARGSAGEIKKISKAIGKAASLASNVEKYGKHIALGLQVAGGVKTIYEYHEKVEEARRKTPNSAEIVGISEFGRAAGGVIGGYAGGLGAALILGTPVGWVGVLGVVGIATVAGALGAYYGSKKGEEQAVDWMKEVDPSRSDEIKMMVPAP